jgi:hypothetical protein
MTPWSPPSPIEALFTQLVEGQCMAALAKEPIADSQLVRMGQSLLLQTGLFPDGCRAWRLKPLTDQTWAAFKTHFHRYDLDRKETATTGSTGYALAATQVSPPVPTTLGSANAITALPSGPELVALLAELAKLRTLQAPQSTSGTSRSTQRGYCWTHGSTANSSHTSATCRNKAPGHVDTATWRNKQGGNTERYVPPAKPST